MYQFDWLRKKRSLQFSSSHFTVHGIWTPTLLCSAKSLPQGYVFGDYTSSFSYFTEKSLLCFYCYFLWLLLFCSFSSRVAPAGLAFLVSNTGHILSIIFAPLLVPFSLKYEQSIHCQALKGGKRFSRERTPDPRSEMMNLPLGMLYPKAFPHGFWQFQNLLVLHCCVGELLFVWFLKRELLLPLSLLIQVFSSSPFFFFFPGTLRMLLDTFW